MKINSNIQAQIANSVLKSNEERYRASTERLSSGYKINHASDSPAGMAITNRMNAQIMSLKKANANSSNAVNVIQTAEGALSEIHDMLQRMKELAVKSSNGTMQESDREAIQHEINQLTTEIERISADTEYNTQNLLGGEQELKGYSSNPAISVRKYDSAFRTGDYQIELAKDSSGEVTVVSNDFPSGADVSVKDGSVTVSMPTGGELILDFDESKVPDTGSLKANLDIHGVGGMKIQVGSSTGQEIQIIIPKVSLKNMNLDDLDLSTQEASQKSLSRIDDAIAFVSNVRSQLGAYQNRLESTISSLDVSIENMTNSYSTIKDVDMAEEMVQYTTLQVLVQAGTQMLTQANEQPQQALQLLQ